MQSGVYYIRNWVNGFVYVGQSIDIERRWSHHRTALRRGYANVGLQKDWRKYGELYFEWLIVEQAPPSALLQLEALHIEMQPKCYNHSRRQLRQMIRAGLKRSTG